MKRILVAGAGHGGLTAAYNLAKKGYDVTVLESKNRENLGYDWHDALEMSAFTESGIPCPPDTMYTPGIPQVFTNPKATVKIPLPFIENDGFNMDRKVLINYLVDCCLEAGVKFSFSTGVIAPLTAGKKVIGLRYEKDGRVVSAFADLVIDAAGMKSPVRTKLPSVCGIEKDLKEADVFYVYRVYYKNTTGEKIDPPYSIHLFHLNRPGIDWFITEEDRCDILVGKFGSEGRLTQEEIDMSIKDFRELYPFMGNEIIRGGQSGVIPLRRMLPLLVCDGYACVGDSAGMTIPLNGCGITLSMKAGKLLSDAVIKAEDGELSAEALWQYEYEYFQNHGKGLLTIAILKKFFSFVSGKNVDFFLEKKILTAKQLAFRTGVPVDKEYVLHLLKNFWRVWYLFFPLIDVVKNVPMMSAVCSSMPEKYDEKKVRRWTKRYKRL